MEELNQPDSEKNLASESDITGDRLAEVSPPTPNDPPWNSITALAVWFLSFVLILVLPPMFIIPYFSYQGIQTVGNPEIESIFLSDPAAVVIGLSASALAHVLTIIFAWFVVTKYNEYSFTEMLGWKWGGFKFWHGSIILISVFAIWLTLASLLGTPENAMSKILESSRVAVFIVVVLATLSAPIVEEVVYRGILYSAFQRTFNRAFAVISVTVIFTLVHVSQYSPDFGAIISLCLLSFLITLVRAKTDNLLPCIAIHLAFNGIQSILLIIQQFLPDTIAPETLPNQSGLFFDLVKLIQLLNLN